MDLGVDGTIGKIEDYFGRTTALIVVGFVVAAIISGCISAIFTYVLVPMYKIAIAPNHNMTFWRAQADVTSALSTLLIVSLIAYFLFIDPPARRLMKQNDELRETIAALIELYEIRFPENGATQKQRLSHPDEKGPEFGA